MKDRLEEFISENREHFDIYEPGERIWKGIRKRQATRRVWHSGAGKALMRVAAVIVIFVASWVFHDYIDKQRMMNGEKQDSGIYAAIPELRETEAYYNNLVSAKMKELQPYFRQVPGLGTEVRGDLSELDSAYASLKHDLKDNIANDEVIEAMIQNYRIKLEILENLLTELKTEQNPVHHEKKGKESAI